MSIPFRWNTLIEQTDCCGSDYTTSRRPLRTGASITGGLDGILELHEPLVGFTDPSSGDKFMPPRGLGHSSCNGGDPVRPDITGTWLELVTTPPSQVWTDRVRELRKLREQGETLANEGRRFGLSAERVRQILLDEDQAVLNPVGAEYALDDNIESAREASSRRAHPLRA